MKKKILVILCWFVIANPKIFAQNLLPPSLQKHQYQWSQQLNRILQKHSKDNNKLNRNDRTGILQLDSTITFTFFDVGGGNTIASPQYRTDHSYPQADLEVATESTFDGAQWIRLYKNTTRRDGLGRVLSNNAELWDPTIETWLPDSRLRAYPRGNSILLDSFYVEGYIQDINDWKRLLTVWNHYDDQDYLQESRSLLVLEDIPLLLQDLYTYDLNGNNILIESALLEGEEVFPAGLEELEYENNLLTVSTVSIYDGFGSYFPETQMTYTYTANAQPDTVQTFFWNLVDEEWSLDQSNYNEYDAENRLIKTENRKFYEEGIEVRSLTSNEYAQEAYLSVQSNFTFDFNNNTFLLDDRTIFYYQELVSSEKPEPVVYQNLRLTPNPSIDEVFLNLEGQATIQIINIYGQILGVFQHQQGKGHLNISNLPAGTYYVKAQAEDNTQYIGTLVKFTR